MSYLQVVQAAFLENRDGLARFQVVDENVFALLQYLPGLEPIGQWHHSGNVVFLKESYEQKENRGKHSYVLLELTNDRSAINDF